MTLPGAPEGQGASEQTRLAAERHRLQTDAVGGSLWISIQTLLGLPLAVVANAVVAHALGARSYGTLAIYTAIYTIAVSLLNAGISDASVQWIATHQARAETHELNEAVRRCSGYHVFVEAPLVAALAAILLRHAGGAAMLIGAGSAAAVMVLGTSTIVMSATGLNALAARISIGVTLATQTTVILIASASPFPTSVFTGRIALSLLAPAIALVLIPKDMRVAVLRPVLPRRWPAGFLGYAVRTCGSGVVTTLVFSRSELFVFQAYHRPEQAGLFALSAGVAGLITAPIDSLLGPLLPATTSLLATSPERAGLALLRGLRTSALLAGLVAGVGIPFLAPLLPLIYGDSFTGAIGAFIALALVSCFQSVHHPVLAFLMAARLTGLLLKTSVMCLLIDIAIAVATIPFIGLAGAVVASAVAQLSVLLVTSYQVGRALGVSLRAQLRAVAYFCEALIIAALALGSEFVLHQQSPFAQSLVGLIVAVAALAIVGRVRRSTGLAPGDIDVIALGLPRPFRYAFHLLVRAFAMESRAAPSE